MRQLRYPPETIGNVSCESVRDARDYPAKLDIRLGDEHGEKSRWLFLQSISEVKRIDFMRSSERFGTMVELGLGEVTGRLTSVRLIGPGEPTHGPSAAESTNRSEIETIADNSVPCLRLADYGLTDDRLRAKFLLPSLQYFPGDAADVVQFCELPPRGVVRVAGVEFGLGEDARLLYFRWDRGTSAA